MVGVSFTTTQSSGVVTTFATTTDVRWQPMKAANIQVGYFLDEASFLAGATPVHTMYFALNISLIDPTLAMPPQIITQLIAVDAPLYGGTPV